MKRMTTASAGALAIVLGLQVGLVAPAAQAQAPYGCACLHNKTERQVNFRYKWGDGEWKPDYLRAGYQETLCWRHAPGSASAPRLSFQIDVDLSGGTAWTTFNLPLVQSQTNRCDAVANKFHYDINYKANTNKQYLTMTHRQ